MPEFLERRYSSGVRFYLAAISIVGYVLTKISVTIAAGAIVFEALMGIDFWTGAVIVVLATGVYTVFGGMRAVLISDAFQTFVMVGGSIAVTIMGLQAVGGWNELRAAAPPEFLSLWRATADPEFPWTGILFGAPILAVWYWCTDQYIVQRTLAAKSTGEARRATFFAAGLKLLPLFIFVVPGVIAYVLAQRGELRLDDPDSALATLIGQLLPAGVRGLVVAGLLAALMSSLSSVFNSAATLVTMDVYKRLAPHHSERRLVLVGQAATVLMVLFGIDELSKIMLIWVGTFFQLVLMVADETRRVPYDLLQVSYTLGARRREVIRLVLFRAAMPGIFDALRLCNGWAWTYLVVAELVAANEGLGYRILKFSRFLQTPKSWVYLILLGVIGLLLDLLFRTFNRRVFHWADTRKR